MGDRDQGRDAGLETRARLSSWPAEDFIRAMGWKLDLAGPLTGEWSLLGRRSAPRGEGRSPSPAGPYYAVALQQA